MKSMLKPLDLHNKERTDAHVKLQQKLSTPGPTGLKCPDCGKELFDSNARVILNPQPPKKEVHCPYCRFKGTRVV